MLNLLLIYMLLYFFPNYSHGGSLFINPHSKPKVIVPNNAKEMLEYLGQMSRKLGSENLILPAGITWHSSLHHIQKRKKK